jgi:hypothetical protein
MRIFMTIMIGLGFDLSNMIGPLPFTPTTASWLPIAGSSGNLCDRVVVADMLSGQVHIPKTALQL